MPAPRLTEEAARDKVAEAGRRKGFEIARWDGYQGTKQPVGVLRCLADGCGQQWSPRHSDAVGKRGCPACAGTMKTTDAEARARVADAGRRKGFEIARWGGYEGSRKPFGVLRCTADGCGHEWPPRYSDAVGKTTGCPKCAFAKKADANRITEGDARKAVEDAGRRKGFSVAKWTGYQGSLQRFGVLRCLADDCGHQWSPIYNSSVKKKRGCPACSETGYDPSKPGWLYYDRIDASSCLGYGAVLYKIGITNCSTPDKRYEGKDRRLVTPIRRVRYENGADARAEEQRILRTFAADRYEGADVLRSGNTELFTRDVLGIDAAASDLLDAIAFVESAKAAIPLYEELNALAARSA